MKRLILLSLVLTFVINVFGQRNDLGKSAYTGLCFSGSNTWLLNKWVFNQGDNQNVAAAFGFSTGLMVGYYFNEDIGVEVNVLYNAHKMKYTGTYGTILTVDYNSETKLSLTDIPVLLKFGSEGYFEIGPVYSMINKAEYKYKTSSTDDTKDVKSDFASSSLGIMVGMGTNFYVSNHFFIKGGVRFMYGFSDIKGVDAVGNSKTDYPTTTDGILDFKNNMAAASLHLGFIYKF